MSHHDLNNHLIPSKFSASGSQPRGPLAPILHPARYKIKIGPTCHTADQRVMVMAVAICCQLVF